MASPNASRTGIPQSGGASLPTTTALLKGDGAGGAVAAVAGTDYFGPNTLSQPQRSVAESFQYSSVLVTAGSGSGGGQQLAYACSGLRRIIIQNPSGSPGNVVISKMDKNPFVNTGANFSNSPNILTTLTPGNEYVDYSSYCQYRARSDLATAPDALIVNVQTEGVF